MATPIADALLALIESRLGRSDRPRVAALHLPPAPGSGGKDAEFGAIALDNGALGLSYLLLDDTALALRGTAAGAPLIGRDALGLARRWAAADASAAERALGFAAVNALSRHLLDRDGLRPADAPDSIAGLDPQPGEHIGMVGYFPPLVKQVTARGARLTVVELRADLAGRHAGFDVTLDPAALRGCDKVLMTSTVLLNDSLDSLLAHCAHARDIAMVGPGAACLPEPLFARGVTALGGNWIEDADGFVAALRSGAPWGRYARKTLWRAPPRVASP